MQKCRYNFLGEWEFVTLPHLFRCKSEACLPFEFSWCPSATRNVGQYFNGSKEWVYFQQSLYIAGHTLHLVWLIHYFPGRLWLWSNYSPTSTQLIMVNNGESTAVHVLSNMVHWSYQKGDCNGGDKRGEKETTLINRQVALVQEIIKMTALFWEANSVRRLVLLL